MEAHNFDSKNWTDAELLRQEELSGSYSDVASKIREIDSKIKEASLENDSLKAEIASSQNRINEIRQSSKILSVESADEVAELTKNIRDVRKKEDELEKQIVVFKDELDVLRNKREQISREIDDLYNEIDERINQKTEINGMLEIKKVGLDLDEMPIVNIDKTSIISTKLSALVVLRSTFADAEKAEINETLAEKINNSGLVKNVDNVSKEEKVKLDEIESRNANYDVAIKAAELAKMTDEELSHKVDLDIGYIGDENNIDKDLVKSVEPLVEKKEETPEISFDTVENTKTIEKDDSVININNIENPIKIDPISTVEKTDNVEVDMSTISKENVENRDDVISITPDVVASNDVVTIDPIKVEAQEEVTPLNNIVNNETVAPISLETESKLETQSVDLKKNTIANAKQERLATINSVYSKDVPIEGMEKFDGGFKVGAQFKAVKKYFENLAKKSNQNASSNENVGNIFGLGPEGETTPGLAIR